MWIVYLAIGIVLVLALAAVFWFVARLLWRSGAPGRVAVVLVLLALGPTLYRAVVPSAAAYRGEFTRLSGLVLPESAEMVERSASFPDFQGRYRACMVLRLAPADAQALQRRLLDPLPPQRLRPCGMIGQVDGVILAMRYRVTHSSPREEALMTIAVEPHSGYVQAQWQIRKRLGAK
jgi:hypothetical protein